MGMAERSIVLFGQGKGASLNRRALIGGVTIALVGLVGVARARPDLRQSGLDYPRVFKVIDRIWRAQNLTAQTLKLGLLDTKALRADVALSGKVWMTTGFVAYCQTEAQVAAWFCQALVGLRTKADGAALDRAALAVLVLVGYDPREALKLWSRWAATKQLNNSSRFTDVPITPDRLQALRGEIEKLGYLI